MNAPSRIVAAQTGSGQRYAVGTNGLPPWDRGSGPSTNLSGKVGTYVVTGQKTAAKLLGCAPQKVRNFHGEGILRDARIIERRFDADSVTFVCVASGLWTRLYLEPGETLDEMRFGDPAGWRHGLGESDSEGRQCLLVRPVADGVSDDLTVVTDRRNYRIRLVGHRSKVTIGCSWTYRDDERRLTPAGEPRRQYGVTLGRVRSTRYVAFILGKSLQDHFHDWASQAEVGKAWQLRRYRSLRQNAAVLASVPHPQHVIAAVLERLLHIGTISVAEIAQWIELPKPEQPVIDMFSELATGRRRNRLPLPAGVRPTPEDMLDPFPFLADLPETSYADDETYRTAPDRARAIAWTMKELAPAAAFFCAVAPGYLWRDLPVVKILRCVASLERIAADAGIQVALDDPSTVKALAEHVLDSPACSHLSVNVRHEMLTSLRSFVRIIRRYIRVHDKKGELGLSRFRPADIPKSVASRVEKFGRGARSQQRANRKARVLRHAGRLADMEFAADLNLEQIAKATSALNSGMKDLGDRDFIDLPVHMTIVDHRGRLMPGTQWCIWRIWNALAFQRLLRRKTTDPSEIRSLDKSIAQLEAKIALGTKPQPVCQYMGTRGEEDETVPIVPFHVLCWRYGLMARAGRMPARMRHKRYMLLRQFKLPGFTMHRAGLLNGSEEEMTIWRIAMRQRRTIAYLEPLEHALRFAHLGFSSVSENLSRMTAWIQQTQDQDGWDVRPLNRVKVAGFLAHDKQIGDATDAEMSWFPVGTAHQKEARDLALMTCRRTGHANGLLPLTLHLEDIRVKRPDPQAWIFSYRDTVLGSAYLHRYLRFLLPGWGRFTFHDQRHLCANAAAEDGVPGWIIRMTLNHGTTDLWEYYAEQSDGQSARFADGYLLTRFRRSADGRSAKAVDRERNGQ